MTAIVFKPSYEAYLIEAHGLSVDDSFPTQAAKKECLRLLSRAYEAITNMKSYKALEEAGLSVFDMPLDLHNVRRAKHYDLFCVAVGNEWAGRVFYLYNERERIKAMPVVKPAAKPKAPAPKTERSATHAGSCQICGRMHKVNVKTGRIASHGYTKQFGGHFNDCFGSHHMPYETHTDRLDWYAKMVQDTLLDCVVARDEAAEAGDKEQYKKQQYMAERCSDLLTNIQQRIDEHKPNQPLTPVEELV